MTGRVYDYSRGRAAKVYTLWHQKPVREVIKSAFDWPAQVYRVGDARHVLYSSDKWEKDGEEYDYSHDFDSHPDVYMVEGPGEGVPTERLLGTKLSGRVVMPHLADVKRLTLRVGGQDVEVEFSRQKPLMSCSVDCRALVVFTSQGPLVIHGGRMVVTSRGIEN